MGIATFVIMAYMYQQERTINLEAEKQNRELLTKAVDIFARVDSTLEGHTIAMVALTKAVDRLCTLQGAN